MKKTRIIFLSVIAVILFSAFTKGLKTIKLSIDWNGDSKKNGSVNIIKKAKTAINDNVTQNFDLHFYENSKKLESFAINIKGFDEYSEWDAESPFQLDSLHQKKSFVLIHNGFPACGYGQNYFLFVKNKDKKIQLLDQYENFFDAPYGNYKSYKTINEASFSSVLVSINESYKVQINGEEDLAEVTKSDSIVYFQKNNRWFKKQITPKEKVFWKREMKLDKALKTRF